MTAAAVMLLASCGSKTSRNINYLQEAQKDTTVTMLPEEVILVQPKDMISIVRYMAAATVSASSAKSTASVRYTSMTSGQWICSLRLHIT